MAKSLLLICPSCDRHVRIVDNSCPFCGLMLRIRLVPRLHFVRLAHDSVARPSTR